MGGPSRSFRLFTFVTVEFSNTVATTMAGTSKIVKMFTFVFCLCISLGLHGCGCDKEAATKCVADQLLTQTCTKLSACYNDNGCCGEDGVETAIKIVCTGDEASNNKCS